MFLARTCQTLGVASTLVAKDPGRTAVIGCQVGDVELVTDTHSQRAVTLSVLNGIRTLEVDGTVLVQSVCETNSVSVQSTKLNYIM